MEVNLILVDLFKYRPFVVLIEVMMELFFWGRMAHVEQLTLNI